MTSPARDNSISQPPEATISPVGERWLLGVILVFTALVYCATFQFQFVYDDEGQIVQNALIQSWRFVPQYFQGHVWSYLFPNAAGNYYRPLNVLWFRLNDAVFGLHHAGWHIAAVLLHVLATWLAFSVARRVTGRPFVAAFTALAFGVHPMRHEVVAWVSGTTESLWSVFCLASFLAYLRSRDSQRMRWMALSCLLFSAALLSKETAIMFPAIIFAYAWIYGASTSKEPPECSWMRLGKAGALACAYVPFSIAYLIVRVIALHGFSHPVVNVSAWTIVLTAPSIAFFYLKQWLLPNHMSEFYDLTLQTKLDAAHVLLPAFALVIVAAMIWLARNKLGSREVAFAATWMVVLLLPSFDVAVFSAGALVHDRYFYLPGFGAALIMALVVAKLANGVPVFGLPQRWLLATLALVGLLAYGTATAARSWENDSTLFAQAYRVAPLNPLARSGYAVEVARNGDYGTAMPILKQLLEERPDYWLANLNYGRICYDLGMFPMAELYLRRALETGPDRPEIYLQLGLLDMKIGRLDLAEGNMRESVTLRPIEAGYRFALAIVLAGRHNCNEAQAQFHEALALQPGFPHAQEQLDKCQSASIQTPTEPSAALRQ
jgi:tetratricopeptide (TPR) repeat protein